MKPEIKEIKPGGWVKLVNGQSVVNGMVRTVTATHVQIEGLYPLPLKYWIPVIVTAPMDFS